MSRRPLRFVVSWSFALLLVCHCAGCGFHLRGTSAGSGAIEGRVQVVADNQFGELARLLRERLRRGGVALVERAADADLVLQLGDERNTRRAATVSREIVVAEYQLRSSVQVNVLRDGVPLAAPVVVDAERTYVFDQGGLVGNAEEETLLRTEMRRDMAERIVGRLGALLESLR